MADTVKSPEDVKAEPAQPKAIRTAAELALTSHVDNFKAPADLEDAAAAQDAEITDLDLPKTAKATHKLMQDILAVEPKSQDEAKVKRGKLARVRAHLTVLEQGTEPAPMTQAAYRQIFASQSAHANELRLGLLATTHPEVKALIAERDGLLKASDIPAEDLAGKMYEAYSVAVGGKAFNGDPLPKWTDFRGDAKKKAQSDAWVAAATTAKQLFGS